LENGSNAIFKEWRQLHTQQAILPVRKEDMSHEERKKAIRYHMFLKEKRVGTIKGRAQTAGAKNILLKKTPVHPQYH